MAQITRRRLLSGAAGAALALITGCTPGDGPDATDQPSPKPLDPTSTPTSTPTPTLTPTLTPRPTPTPPDRTPIPAPGEIVVTPNDEFFTTYWKDPSVGVDVETWRLEIDGLVDRPLSLRFDELQALPAVEEMRTLACIGNPPGGDLVGNAVWKGFYLAPLLKEAGIQPEAVRAQFAAADGYWTSVDLAWITRPGVLMAYEMNGEPLPYKHGYPLRILMPGLYGQKMPKWLTRIRFTDEVVLGVWERRGWSDVAAVQTNSHIWQPRELKVTAGAVTVYGIAYAAPREIVRVELRIDGGEWIEAELLRPPSPLVWTQWHVVWQASPGDHRLSVRATDSEGFVQSTKGSGVFKSAFPQGSNGIHEVAVSVV